MRMEGDVGSRLVDGAQCSRVISAERSVERHSDRNFCSVVACGMSRELFYQRFRKCEEAVTGNNSRVVQDAEHGDIMRFLMDARPVEERPLTSKERRWMATYHVVDYGVAQKLLRKGSKLEVVKKSDIFDRIHEAHTSGGHCGRDKLRAELVKHYYNIGQKLVSLYLGTCSTCEEKRKRPRKGLVSKPILSQDMCSRAQVDLICFESEKDGPFSYILTYQDHLTKFVTLRALKSKRAEEVAYHLLDIFCVFGAPAILQSDNGREFTSSLITEVTSMWPKLNIVHGKPRHSQSQGSVERANRTVEEKLACWMKDNGTKRWSEGLRFVQWQINTQVNSGIGRSPYKAMFGTEPKLGLATTTLPSALTSVLHTEEELRDALDEPDEPGRAGPSFLEQPSTSSTSICLECGRQVEAATECPCLTEEPPAAAERRKARVHQSAQAERMLKRARSSVAPISVGDNVTVGIPDVDRSRIEHRNLICVVLEEKEDGFTLGCKQGRLGFYTRNQLEPCRERHVKEADVPEKATTVREAARAQSGGKGQGFLRCSCAKRCLARCKCVRAMVACNSRCHHSKICNNV